MRATVKILCVLALFGLTNPGLHGQSNDFRIGMFGFNWEGNNPGNCTVNENVANSGGNPSTQLCILKSDGFNVAQNYSMPDTWFPEAGVQSVLNLVNNVNSSTTYTGNGLPMKVHLQGATYYVPTVGATPPTGTNIYNNTIGGVIGGNPGQQHNYPCEWKPRANYDWLFANLYNNATYKDIVWGLHMAEEPEYCHAYNYTNAPGPWQEAPCGNTMGNFYTTEVPAQKVRDAIDHFESVSTGNQKFVIMNAYHGKFINDYCADGFYGSGASSGWNSQDYMKKLNIYNKHEVSFEGSYLTTNGWLTQNYTTASTTNDWHYLSKFASIDYAKTKAASVHAVIFQEIAGWPYDAGASTDYRWIHSNTSVPNGNWLWFQAYNSVIHGADGVWFWGNSFAPCERENIIKTVDGASAWTSTLTCSNYGSYTSTQQTQYFTDLNNTWNALSTKNKKDHFSAVYNNFISNLSREMGYLVKNNLLSSDPASIIYSKTISADANCILPNAAGANSSSYIYNAFVADVADGYGSSWVSANSTIMNEKCSEIYGLRYTLRTNGTDVIMIISNPLNIPVKNVPLNFNSVANPLIQNATGVDVLFENGLTAVDNAAYKTSRNASINLTANTVGTSYYIPFTSGSNKTFNLSFGPMDVHILRFKAATTYSVTGYANGWEREWSNNGNSTFTGWGLSDNDRYVAGNFYNDPGNVDNGQELLCIQGTSVGTWSTLLKYSNAGGLKNWLWIWSNYGSTVPGATGWNINSFDKYIPGDFDGDGVDELLCLQLAASNAKAVLLKFNISTFTWSTLWSNVNGSGVGSGVISGWGIATTEKFLTADFDYPTPDTKKELLAIDIKNSGWWSVLRYNTPSFPNDWQWIMGGGPTANQFVDASTSTTLWTNDATCDYVTGDFDAVNGKNEILCYKHSGTTTTKVIRYDNGYWRETWSNGGSTSIGGWGSPVNTTDAVLTGNVDADSKEEVMFAQNCASCGWAQTVHLDATNQIVYGWGNHAGWYPTASNNYIDDWYLGDPTGTNSQYFFMKPFAGNTNYLVALRKYGCNKYLASMYYTNGQPSGVDYRMAQEMGMTNALSMTSPFTVFPNPNTGTFNIAAQSVRKDMMHLTVYNLVGEKIREMSYELQEGSNEFALELNECQNGVYYVHCSCETFNKTEKVIIAK